jgi:hypothetical protein
MDVREVMQKAFSNAARMNPDHFATLFGQRTSGSQWGSWIPMKPEDYINPLNGFEHVKAEDLPPGCHISGCLYFRSANPRVLKGAIEQVAALNELPEKDRQKVRVEMGEHGPVLMMDDHLPIRTAKEAWLIIAPFSRDRPDLLISWKAFPGRLVAEIDPEIARHPTDLAGLLALGLPFGVKSTKDKRPVVKSL